MTNKIKNQGAALIPTKHGVFKTIAYAVDKNEKMPHIVLLKTDLDVSKPVNVRIHSECMTGDVFGSFRCECGEQLAWAMEYVNENDGLIIYLRQEGRGIGIINKLHAYVKQDEGYDTAEANKVLGFGYDERTYEEAAEILNDLNIKEVNLLTNNPEKIKQLDSFNIKVVSQIAVQIPSRPENHGYLKTKKDFFGHKIENL